jgi:hypothetical protein
MTRKPPRVIAEHAGALPAVPASEPRRAAVVENQRMKKIAAIFIVFLPLADGLPSKLLGATLPITSAMNPARSRRLGESSGGTLDCFRRQSQCRSSEKGRVG